ncbi:hypothetical protein B0H14DRAFT_2600759 [Mycena olivaceomarginata]|nr:hypothetical protein B0H14DRAFT_2600759 [Mycena olivaceomarginata]
MVAQPSYNYWWTTPQHQTSSTWTICASSSRELSRCPSTTSARWNNGCARMTGVKDSLHSDEEENTLDVVRLQISEMANNNLCKVKNNKKLEMEWTNHKIRIVHEFGVEWAGWPTEIDIRPPSKIPADDAQRIWDLMQMEKIQLVALTRSQREKVAKEIEEMRASGALPKRKSCCNKGETCRPHPKKGAATADGSEHTILAVGASAATPGASVPISSAAGPGVSALVYSATAPGMSTPVLSTVTPGVSTPICSAAAPVVSIPVYSTATPGMSAPILSAAAPGVLTPHLVCWRVRPRSARWRTSPSNGRRLTFALGRRLGRCGTQILVMAGISPSPLIAISATGSSSTSSVAFDATVAQNAAANGSIVSLQLEFRSNFQYDFDLDLALHLHNPSFVHQLDPDAHTLRLNTSNRTDEDWSFDSYGANGPFVNGNNVFANDHTSAVGAHFATGHTSPLNADLYTDIRLGTGLSSSASLALPSSSFRGDGVIFPGAVSTNYANTTTAPAGYSTSVFSMTTNTVAGAVRKPPCKTCSDKDQPRGPRKKKDGTAGADADGDVQPKPKKRKRAAPEAA